MWIKALENLKNKPAIAQLFLANSISGVAQGISMIAIPWYFAQQGEMGKFALTYIVVSVFSLFWAPYSGTLVDKYNRKHIFLVITTISGLLLTMIAFLGLYGMGSWWLVGSVFVLTFSHYNIHYPNLYAFMQEISEEKYYGKITSYLEIIGQFSNVIAGAGAALLLEGTQDGLLNVLGFEMNIGFNFAAWSIYEIFLLDAGTYFISFLLILAIQYKSLITRKPEIGSVQERLKIGWNYLKTHPNIFLFGVASYSIFVTILLTLFYLNATYVSNHLQAKGDVYASSEIYYAIGAIFAGLAIWKIFKWTTIPMAIIVMTMLSALCFAILFGTSSILVFFAMCLLLGMSNAGTRVMRITYLFTHVPNQVYGRASSIFFLTNIIFRIIFLGIFSLGFFHVGNHVIFAFLMLSIFLALSGMVLIKYYRSFLIDVEVT